VSQPATGRHRASARLSTPLTPLTAAVSDRAEQVGRGGVIIAMTSGLVMTLALPGQQAAFGQAIARWTRHLSVSGPAANDALHVALPPVATGAMDRGQSPTVADAAGGTTSTRPTATPRAVTPAHAVTGGHAVKGGHAVTGGHAVSGATVHQPPSTAAGARRAWNRRAFTGTEADPLPAAVPATAPVAPRVVAHAARGASVLALAARYVGVPYRFGGSRPSGFDCSGYVKYVFALAGVTVPRTADQQLQAATPIRRSKARAGDLVFFVAGGRAYHNGIYAGDGMIYDAPSSGRYVSKRPIWSATVIYARFGS
jgi:cell wall-associated NlpC family hydrolase